MEGGITARYVRNEEYTAPDYEPGWEAEAEVAWPAGGRRMGVQLYGGQTVFGEEFFSTALWMGWR